MPHDGESITHCSTSFLKLWGIEAAPPHGVETQIMSVDGSVGDRLEKLGLDRDYLQRLLKDADGADAGELEDAPVSAIQRIELTDDSGDSAGIMLLCENNQLSHISREICIRAAESRRRLATLSPRESQILELVFDGFTNKAVGLQIEISEKTVEKHRANIMRKLRARSVVELIRRVTEANLCLVEDCCNDAESGQPLDQS